MPDDDLTIDDIVKGEQSRISKMIEKHGPWALGCFMLGTAFYLFTLQPQKADRDIFVETLRENSRENRENSRENRKSIHAMEQNSEVMRDTMIEIRTELKEQTKQRAEAINTMGEFSRNVITTHDKAQDSLDRIEKQTEPE